MSDKKQHHIPAGLAVEIADVMLQYYDLAVNDLETAKKIVNPSEKDKASNFTNNIMVSTVESIVRTAIVTAAKKQYAIESLSLAEVLCI